MNSLKSILFILTIIGVCLVACDNREDAFGYTDVPYVPDTIPKDTIPDDPAGKAPIASFTALPTNIIVGQSVQFTDQSTNTPTIWSWDFGDGGTSTIKSPLHTYNTPGIYTVELTVTNDYGTNIRTEAKYIVVNNNELPIINAVCEVIENKIYITLNGSDPDGEIVGYNYRIDDCGFAGTSGNIPVYIIDIIKLNCERPLTICIKATDNNGGSAEACYYITR